MAARASGTSSVHSNATFPSAATGSGANAGAGRSGGVGGLFGAGAGAARVPVPVPVLGAGTGSGTGSAGGQQQHFSSALAASRQDPAAGTPRRSDSAHDAEPTASRSPRAPTRQVAGVPASVHLATRRSGATATPLALRRRPVRRAQPTRARRQRRHVAHRSMPRSNGSGCRCGCGRAIERGRVHHRQRPGGCCGRRCHSQGC